MIKHKEEKMAHLKHLMYIWVWVVIVTLGGHLLGIHCSWVYCLSVPLYFLMAGDMKERLLNIFCGGVTGMLITYVMCKGIVFLKPILGDVWGWAIPIVLALAVLMLMMPFAPHFFNNVGISYLVIATIDAGKFCEEIGSILICFIVGSAIYFAGIILIMKWIKAKEKKKVHN